MSDILRHERFGGSGMRFGFGWEGQKGICENRRKVGRFVRKDVILGAKVGRIDVFLLPIGN
jgi:hypothetical protein